MSSGDQGWLHGLRSNSAPTEAGFGIRILPMVKTDVDKIRNAENLFRFGTIVHTK